MDSTLLAALSSADDRRGNSCASDASTSEEHQQVEAMRLSLGLAAERPRTASGAAPPLGAAALIGAAAATPATRGDPITAGGPGCRYAPGGAPTLSHAGGGEAAPSVPSPAAHLHWTPPPGSASSGTQLVCTVLSTWGDANYFGLAGLQLLGERGEVLPLTPSMLSASPADLNEMQPGANDPRTLDKLVDGVNVGVDSNHSWLAPWEPHTGRTHTLTIELPRGALLSGLRVWNYNKSEEDSQRGVRQMVLHLDGVLLSPPNGVLLRKAPGHARYDHAQLIPLHAARANAGAAGPEEGCAEEAAHREALDGAYVGSHAAMRLGYVPFAPLAQVCHHDPPPARGLRRLTPISTSSKPMRRTISHLRCPPHSRGSYASSPRTVMCTTLASMACSSLAPTARSLSLCPLIRLAVPEEAVPPPQTRVAAVPSAAASLLPQACTPARRTSMCYRR